jgi:hypothetical protein
MQGRQQGTDLLNNQAHLETMKSCPVELAFVTKTTGGSWFIHQSGKPGQVLTGAALPRTTDVCRDTGSRIEVANLIRDVGSNPAARRTEKRRGGKEGAPMCKFWGVADQLKKKKHKK